MNDFNQPLVIKPKADLTTDPSSKRKRGVVKKIIFNILIIILLAGGFWFYQTYTMSKNVLTDKQVLDEVKKIMVLPTGETPTITTVTNPDEIRYQPFFMNAAVGDQVIIYLTAKRAVLFRPSTKQIVEASNLR